MSWTLDDVWAELQPEQVQDSEIDLISVNIDAEMWEPSGVHRWLVEYRGCRKTH